jgi:uncharacterized protein (TIGR03067 family)
LGRAVLKSGREGSSAVRAELLRVWPLTTRRTAGYTPTIISKEAAMSRSVLILLAVVSLGFAPAPFLVPRSDCAVADLKALQGEWELVSINWNGVETKPDSGRLSWVFAQDRLTILIHGELNATHSVTLDLKRIPKVMHCHSSGHGEFRSNYSMEGPDILIDSSTDAGPPPSSFKPGRAVRVLIFRRRKP